MSFSRKKTRVVNIGGIFIGGDNPIAIQSMCNTKTKDSKQTIEQIHKLEDEGCEIIRVAINDMEAAGAISEIKKNISIPLVGDIHFDYRLAVAAIENGIDKIRINPGNIGSIDRIKAVVDKARERNIPIRIGVNSGSLEKPLLVKYGGITAQGLAESALNNAKIVEDLGYDNLVLSLKATSVPLTLAAHEIAADNCDYPIHIGITEAGTPYTGIIRSAAGVSAMLTRGIGDTIRVSLTSDPIQEVTCAKEILKSLEIRKFGIDFVSCPTCGRTEIDLIGLADTVEKKCRRINKNIKVAVMGCILDGPGEAKDADIGIAGGAGCGVIFKKGQVLCTVQEADLAEALMAEIDKL